MLRGLLFAMERWEMYLLLSPPESADNKCYRDPNTDRQFTDTEISMPAVHASNFYEWPISISAEFEARGSILLPGVFAWLAEDWDYCHPGGLMPLIEKEFKMYEYHYREHWAGSVIYGFPLFSSWSVWTSATT